MEYMNDKGAKHWRDVYLKGYLQHGYSPNTLRCGKAKQDLRFRILTSQYDFTEKSVLDIGCGFGDLNKTLACFDGYSYLGVDVMEEFINEAKKRYENDRIKFKKADITKASLDTSFNYAIASGIFNQKFEEYDNYAFIETIMKKTFELVNDGFAFDFLSNKVDYCLEDTFHSDPAVILNMAYRLSRNVILRNDYVPFEFSVFVFKDDSFEKSDTIFKRYKTLTGYKGS